MGDKDQVLREAFRVLKPGGRFAVSDVVSAAKCRRKSGKYGAVGRLHRRALEDRVLDKLGNAGFDGIEIEPTRVYDIEDAEAFLPGRAGRGRDRSEGRTNL